MYIDRNRRGGPAWDPVWSQVPGEAGPRVKGSRRPTHPSVTFGFGATCGWPTAFPVRDLPKRSTVSTSRGGGDSPTPPRGEVGEDETTGRKSRSPVEEGALQGVARETAMQGGSQMEEAREGASPPVPSEPVGGDQMMTDAGPREPAQPEQPGRAPTAAELTALMQQPDMLAVLRTMVEQAAATEKDRKAQEAAERVAQAEREAEAARRELRQQELALEELRSRQAELEAKRQAQRADVMRLSEQLRQTKTATTSQVPQTTPERQSVPSGSSQQPLPRIVEEEGEVWQVAGRPGLKRRSPTPGEPESDSRRQAETFSVDIHHEQRVRSEIRPRTPPEEGMSSGESLTESARRVCTRSPRHHSLPTFGTDEESQDWECPLGVGPIYSRPRRCFAKWTRFHSSHLDQLDAGWDIAEDHVGQKLTVRQLIKYRR